ncbi:hypothetical protein [Roseibium sp.]|uniref:hypothetical protein n=1 Tax=Roseibium sp. TaxID=1936156 RepID=UPI003A9720DB
MMIEPKSSATILALADLADLSAKQLEEGRSIEEVIATLRSAAEAVRSVIDPSDRFPPKEASEEDILDADMAATDKADEAESTPDEISA